jgi:alpha-ketoglutarate-dependent 2,4-dichlorophenoxyacetate dioxygenase
MSFKIKPLHPLFAAEVTGFDFSAAPEKMPIDEILAAIDKYGVLAFRNATPPTDEQHVAFSRMLGPIERGKLIKVTGHARLRLALPELVDVGNLDPDGNILPPDSRQMKFRMGDRLWHADMSFMDNRATYSLLLGHEIPSVGGDTEFADMRAAFAELPRELQHLAETVDVEHSIWHSREMAGFPPPTEEELLSRPPVRHKLAHVHARSGRKSLYVTSHASHIIGWPVDLGRGLLSELTKFATQPKFVYRHKWQLGDLLMWDNLATLHRATEFEDAVYRRDMRRTTCRERAIEGADAAYA